MNNSDTFVKAAREVVVGEVVVEQDGFMWRVVETSWYNGTTTLRLVPVFASMTARGEVTKKFRKSAGVRVAMYAPEVVG